MMRLSLFLLAGMTFLSAPAIAQSNAQALAQGQRIHACLTAAAVNAQVPARVLHILLYVEGGHAGSVVRNTNGTADLGPMQVNTLWVRKVAAHWHTTPERAYAALRDNVCANIEAGSWILGQGMREARGDLWQAVAFYHSHTTRYNQAYLRRFYHIATDMMKRTSQEVPS